MSRGIPEAEGVHEFAMRIKRVSAQVVKITTKVVPVIVGKGTDQLSWVAFAL